MPCDCLSFLHAFAPACFLQQMSLSEEHPQIPISRVIQTCLLDLVSSLQEVFPAIYLIAQPTTSPNLSSTGTVILRGLPSRS